MSNDDKFNFWKSPLLNLLAKGGDSLTTIYAINSGLCYEAHPVGVLGMGLFGTVEYTLAANIVYPMIFFLCSFAHYVHYSNPSACEKHNFTREKAFRYYNIGNLFGAAIAGAVTLFNLNSIITALN